MLAIWSQTRQKSRTCSSICKISKTTAVDHRDPCNRCRNSRPFWSPTSTATYTIAIPTDIPNNIWPKLARNKQWSKVFLPSKEALSRKITTERAWRKPEGNTAEADQSRIHLEATTPDDAYNELDWAAVQRVAGMELSIDDILHDDHALAAWVDQEVPQAETQEWPANTGPHLVRQNLPPQSLWALESMRLTAMRQRHTWKKLAVQTLSTGLLIHRLMRKANASLLYSTKRANLMLLSSPLHKLTLYDDYGAAMARKEIMKAIKKIQDTHVESSEEEITKASPRVNVPAIPSYYQDNDGDFHSICAQMNDAINMLFSQLPDGGDRDEGSIIAKICHNLLVSTASPNLQTFNILLAGFKRWQRSQLVDDVIMAFSVQHIRPNEITCCEILDYYASQSRPDDFVRFVEKMRAARGSLMLASPHIDPIYEHVSQGRLVRFSETKVDQKVYPTPMVFGALVAGVLKFAGFDRALDIYYELKADGWGLDISGLTKLLRDCVRRADWEGAMYLWEEINTIKWDANAKDMARAYYHMLALCTITGNTVAFNQLLQEIVKRGFHSKSIINAAARTAQQVQKMKEYPAPAWMADNVLIAVSQYINDAGQGGSEDLSSLESESENLFDGLPPEQSDPEPREEVDEKELWAQWVRAELGGNRKDPER